MIESVLEIWGLKVRVCWCWGLNAATNETKEKNPNNFENEFIIRSTYRKEISTVYKSKEMEFQK
jgi:hypothetical protein